MTLLRVPIVRIGAAENAPPAYFSEGAAGLDLSAAGAEPVVIPPGGFRLIPCGFAVAIPPGFEGQIRPRSGLASRHGVTVLNAPGTIDSDYRGEIKVLLVNLGGADFTVVLGMRIAQLVVSPVVRVQWEMAASLPDSNRGVGGFGHTGA